MIKDSNLTIRLNEQEKQKIKELASKRDISVSQLIRELCREVFDKEDK